MARLEDERAVQEKTMEGVRAAIKKHAQQLLEIKGVVSIGPGYKFCDGSITDTPAVVVKVGKKLSLDKLVSAGTEILPKVIDGVQVDVLTADPLSQLRLLEQIGDTHPAGLAESWRVSLEVGNNESGVGLPLLDYVPPSEPAKEIDQEMTVTCHTSCDSGFVQLKGFFERIETLLVSTMYEFTAQHVLDALVKNLPSPKKFEFIFDGKTKSRKKDDLPIAEVIQHLREAISARMTFAWAANAQAKGVVTAGFFPMAYHIKVSVRDEKEVWLSSGNWKNSGQPVEDPFTPSPDFNASRFEKMHDRDWHLLIENADLAKQFVRYIQHDIKQAMPLQRPVEQLSDGKVLPDVFVPEVESTPIFRQPLIIKNKKMRALLLFTPDNSSYFEFVKNLVRNAKKSILFENQSLSPSKTDKIYMEELFLVLRDKCLDQKIDVKIIVRGDFSPDVILTDLQSYGFPLDRVRLLGNVHTKGLIVDDEVIVIGSHNWTGQGVRKNRDASIVFWDREIIDYYKMFFDYDWNRASNKLGPVPMLAQAGVPAPAGFIRVPWSFVNAE